MLSVPYIHRRGPFSRNRAALTFSLFVVVNFLGMFDFPWFPNHFETTAYTLLDVVAKFMYENLPLLCFDYLGYL